MRPKQPGRASNREVEKPVDGQTERHYVTSASKARLRRLLKDGALRGAERDRSLAEEWSALDEAPENSWPNGRRRG